MNKREIEAKLLAGYEAGDVDTGLYHVYLLYVVFDMVDGQPSFTWFDQAHPLPQL